MEDPVTNNSQNTATGNPPAAANPPVNTSGDNQSVSTSNPPATSNPPGPTTQDILAKVEQLNQALNSGKNAEEQESAFEKFHEETGITKKGFEWINQSVTQFVVDTTQKLNIAERTGRKVALEALGNENSSFLNDVEEVMASQSVAIRQNPESWKNAAYMVKGKNADKMGRVQIPQGTPSNTGVKITGGNVEGLSRPSAPASQANGGGKSYTAAEQVIISKYFDGKSEDYDKHNSTKRIDEIKPGFEDKFKVK